MRPSTAVGRALGAAIAAVGTAGVAASVMVPVAPPAEPSAPAPAVAARAATDQDAAATEAAAAFLDTYVDGGRVVRADQGGDTVSEGQAYAMLVALAVDDHQRFEALWRWTRTNLEQPSGLLAWRWQDGAVVDASPASDADVLVAWALLKAAERFGVPGYRTDGERLAAAVLDHETVEAGGPVLVAGPWARRRAPHFVVPGYFAPPVFADLAALTGDDRWTALHDTSREIVRRLVRDPTRLVADWARVDTDGRAVVHGVPGSGSSTGVHGLDAARAYVWFAVSCDARDRALAAAVRPFHRDEAERGIALSYELDGSRTTDNQHALMWVAAASSAAASRDGDVARLLDVATAFDEQYPSYYGSAWVALGRLLLTTDRLHTC